VGRSMIKKNIVAGLEMSRNKLSMAAAEIKNGNFDLLFTSKVRCQDGIKNGAIINLDSVTEAMLTLLEEARQKGEKGISSVFVNISGLNIKQELVNSAITLPQRGCEITQKHIKDLIESCKIVSVPMDKYLLHLFPLEYKIDGQEGVRDPLGLCGNRLEAEVMIVTAPFNQVQNIIKAVNFCGMEAEEVILTAVANTHSMLTDEEKKQGVLLIDLKTDSTEISIFKEYSLLFFKAIPKGQANITNKIATRLNVPFEIAEELKIKYGFLDSAQQDARNQDVIPVEWLGEKQNITRGEINKIVSEQLESIFNMILQEIRNFKAFSNVVKAGAVISGGCTDMEGIMEWVNQNLKFTVKRGSLKQNLGSLKQDLGSAGHDYTTSLGLLEFGLKKRQKRQTEGNTKFFKKVFRKTGELLSDYF